VVHLAGHYPRLSLDRAGTLALASRQMQTLLDAMAKAGARRLVYISSTATVAPAAAGTPSTEKDRYPAPPGFGTYHDLKWALEAQVEAEARFETVTLCPGACVGAHDYRLGTAAFLAATARQQTPPHPDGLVNVIDVRDVGLAVAKAVLAQHVPTRVILSGSTHSLHALLERVARRYDAPTPSPALLPHEAVALADAEEHRAATERTRAGLSRELVDLVIHGVPVDPRLSQVALGMHYRPLTETLDAFDEWARRIGIITPPPPPSPSLAAPEKTT
jgi:nucleoside-diphosphate-sugar epimerase